MQQLMKKVTRKDIEACKAEAERLYMGRLTGYVDDISVMPVNGVYPRFYAAGAIEEFIATTADGLIDLVLEKASQGWSKSDVMTQAFTPANLPMQFAVYLLKPEAVRAEELKEVHKQAEAKLHAAVVAENEAIIQRTFEQRVATERRKREEAAKAAQEAEEAELMAEVRAELMGGK
ncbi:MULTISPECIES: hypothetical protein [unclassified Pseudomonas]|uniref:hypothetical protein n=1 Tax=unclassified Pseudomonas TaxID=196821 RepID=UPI000A1D764F|nr:MULTISPECIES: hypothetical protein [unclassified Pseudomonas]